MLQLTLGQQGCNMNIQHMHRAVLAKDAAEAVTTDMVFTMRVAALETITLPATGTNNFVVDWGDESSETVTTASPTHQYTDAGDYEVRLDGTCTAWYFNNGGSKDNLIAIANLGVMGWGTTFLNAFKGCSNLVTVTLGNTDIDQVTTFERVFSDCSSLVSVDTNGWVTSNITSFNASFYNCSSLTVLNTSSWDTSAIINFRYAFSGCKLLPMLETSGWNTSEVTNFSYTFNDCWLLNDLDVSGWDMSKVTLLDHVFASCLVVDILDTSGWLTPLLVNLQYAFADCQNLGIIDVTSWDVSKVTTCSRAFINCTALTNLGTSGWVPSLCTTFAYGFNNCALTEAEVDGVLAMCVAGGKSTVILDINLGTNSPPSAAGLANKDILVGRGWTVTVNT